jgi:hypothetical protein
MANAKKWNREKLKFDTVLEKEMHKVISSINYGQKVNIKKAKCFSHKEVENAIKKSAFYNCMDITIRWEADKESINVGVDLV